ncbi:maleylpyruvate isomerase family mycothiol-dependent enzyme [Streptomyces sp. S6]
MTLLTHERYCDEIELRVEGLREVVRSGADPGDVVPTCPEWSLRELLWHVGGELRWVAVQVRDRVQEFRPIEKVSGEPLDAWLGESGDLVVGALREAGPEARVWAWTERQDTGFWARRMAHELTVHSADAAFTAGVPYEVAPEMAADAIDEWLEIVVWVQRNMPHQGAKELVGQRTWSIRLETPGAEWFVEWGPDGVAWRRAHEKADVVMRGTLTDVMLAFYRRLPLDAVEVLGERQVLEYWLERATMG